MTKDILGVMLFHKSDAPYCKGHQNFGFDRIGCHCAVLFIRWISVYLLATSVCVFVCVN